jgi:hypothetical protein
MVEPNKKFDFNDAGEQRSFDLIPAGAFCSVQLTIRPGGAGDGWLRTAKDGASEALDCEFTVLDGEHAKRKIWALYTVNGTTPGHGEAAEISRKALCAMLESARGIRPDDRSETAQKARQVGSWGEFDGLRFIVRVGVRSAQGDYPAKNTVTEIITPNRQTWRQLEQLPPEPSKAAPKPATGTAASATSNTPTATASGTAVPTRPQWAK